MNLNQLTFAGNISAQETWDKLQDDPRAVLIDVRTPEEWAYVGVPDLSSLERTCVFVPWSLYPNNALNPNFVHQVLDAVKPDDDTPLLLICRSGVRSAYAAHALTEMGYEQCYNVQHGFEGDPDAHKHRGTVNGWKVAGLPWMQG